MGFHAVVAVVGAQRKKFRQIAVPDIEIHRHSALAHTQLIDGDSGVVGQSDPANDAAGCAFKTTDRRAHGADLAEIEPHTAAEFAHLGKIVDAAVDALEAVGHGVDEAARELVKRLARIGQRRRRHRHLEGREHVVEAAHPVQTLLPRFQHRQMQRDTEEHFLHAFQRHAGVAAHDVAFEQKLDAGIIDQLVAAFVDEGRCFEDLLAAVVLQDVAAVEAFLGEVFDLFVEIVDAVVGHALCQGALKLEKIDARGDKFPARRFLGRQLHTGLDEKGEALCQGKPRLVERLELDQEIFQPIHLAGKIALDLFEELVHFRHFREAGGDHAAGAALALAVLAVEDEAFDFFIIVFFDECFFDQVLNVFHVQRQSETHFLFEGLLDGVHHRVQFFGSDRAFDARKGALNDAGDFGALVRLGAAVAFDNVHWHWNPFY